MHSSRSSSSALIPAGKYGHSDSRSNRKHCMHGELMTKFSYSDSRAIVRYFWLSPDSVHLYWGLSKKDSKPLKVKLVDAIAIVLGPVTTTFARVVERELRPWECFSLIFVGRTLDLRCDSANVHTWFSVLQDIISPLDKLTRFEFVRKTVQMKIQYRAKLLGRSLVDHFRITLKEGSLMIEDRAPVDKLKVLNLSVLCVKEDLIILKQTMHEFRSIFSNDLKVLMNKLEGSKYFSTRSVTTHLCSVEEDRKRLHNELMELKGNIRVFCRIRFQANPLQSVFEKEGRIIVDYDARKRVFSEFDCVFGPSSSQTNIYEQVRPFIQSAIDGYNVCILAYGATGGGKTYTMEGTPQQPGINMRAINQILENTQGSLGISIFQVYNEQVFDLLDSKQKEVKLTCEGDEFALIGLTHKNVHSFDEAVKLMLFANAFRVTSKTRINETSSRSHCIVNIRLSNGGVLNLVDLAGSENVNKSGAQGIILKEAQNINKSLASLGDVIHQLIVKNKAHVPYRNSKLTMILKSALKGNSKALMILQVSPDSKDVTETLGTLTFGTRVRTVELGKANLNHTHLRE